MATGTEMALRDAAISRQEFGALEVKQQNETAAVAVAKQAEAQVQARYLMAMRNRRVIDEFREVLLKECSRPTFAPKAKYSKPLGNKKDDNGRTIKDQFGKAVKDKVEGPSIRFVEVAVRCFKNVDVQTPTIYESDDLRIVQVTASDLESNIHYSQGISIAKSVERKGYKKGNVWEPPSGRTVISQRENSYGDQTYLVVATEDEVLAKQNALISKTTRTLCLRLLPGDIVEEALEKAEHVANQADASDPDAAKRKILDSFAADLGIGVKEIAAYLGHPVDIVSLSEVADLRKVYQAVKSGESTWYEVLQASTAEEGGSAEAAKNGMADKLKTMQSDQKAAKNTAPTTEQQTTAASTDEPRDNSQDDPGPPEGLFDAQQSKGSNAKPGGFGSRKN